MLYDKEIHLSKPGTLADHLSYSERNTLTSLKVSGRLNQEDLSGVLSKMCNSKGDYEGESPDDKWIPDIEHSPKLRYLDLSECHYEDGTVFPNVWYYPVLKYFAFPQGIETDDDDLSSSLECSPLLEEVVLPQGMKKVGGFNGCEKLAKIVIPDSVTDINDYAFSFCRVLTHIRIPKNVRHIGEGAFAQTGISAIEIDGDNPYFSTVDGVVFSKDLKTLIAFPGSPREHYSMPQGTESIAPGAFDDCNVDSLTIPDSVTDISYSAFQCSGLRELWVPDNVKHIGGYCFRGSSEMLRLRLPCNIEVVDSHMLTSCHKLELLILPYYLKEIDAETFAYCCSLQCIVCPSPKPPLLKNIQSENWKEATSNPVFHVAVPASSLSLYESAEGWGQVRLKPIEDVIIQNLTVFSSFD